LTEKIFPNKFSLDGKIAVVTGGAGLIGKKIVQGFAEAGAFVYIADSDKNTATKLEKQLSGKKSNVKWIEFDITKLKSINICIEKIIKEKKKVDIWVNSAYPKTADWGNKLEDIKEESLRKNVDMQLNGYFLSCQQIAKQMKKQKSGVIINLSSIYGLVGPDFSIYEGTKLTTPAAYSAIKGGINAFTKYFATYYGKYGIRANVICSGGIFDNQPKNFVKNYEEKTPLNKMGNADDIAGAAIFLAADAGSYITGHILMIDGGWTSW
jgi:NAD(P)-dependent dehydrogenase (short-subunit alcohol dehydrogenase family)